MYFKGLLLEEYAKILVNLELGFDFLIGGLDGRIAGGGLLRYFFNSS